MKLIYLSHANIQDRLFIKDFVHNFHFKKEKALVIHAPIGEDVTMTRFATKRISSLLSEAMVYNNAFSADQRNLFYKENGKMQLKAERILQLVDPIYMVLLGPIIASDNGAILADPVEMLQAAREALPIDEVLTFTANPMSPLGTKRALVDSEEGHQQLMRIYDEEQSTLDTAFALRPARIVLPTNYSPEC